MNVEVDSSDNNESHDNVDDIKKDGEKRIVLKTENVTDFLSKSLEDFVTGNTINIFKRFNISTDFLNLEPEKWNQHTDYVHAVKIVYSIRPVNDTAERGVKLFEEFNRVLGYLLPFAVFLFLTLVMTTNDNINCIASLLTLPEATIVIPDEMDNCPIGFFHCNTSVQCVPQRLNCDGAVDCDDASDEWNCVNDVDAKFWDHLFRKQPFGRHDDVPIGTCLWPSNNLSCPCRGNEILCRFQQMTSVPLGLPMNDVATLDLTGNNFTTIDEHFFQNIPVIESLVLKFCSIQTISPFAFKTLSENPLKTIYLDENKIQSLPKDMFPAGNVLGILILSGNQINELHNYDFEHLENLEELDLRSNRIETFELDVFKPMVNLEVL
ncbi:relaxin receptor 1-like [Teleopsis dalmanni]|uniref:relaxin receptor 1-like n=1 Tax=Teleopsis dalmanni TaxID=139649 RepID=UPI0018CF40CD|nr:relaxin receptor 1-like [Teleopsis dalmanni]